MRTLLQALCGMIGAALLVLLFMAALDVRSMVWPLLGYAFVTTWALLTIGIRRTMGAPEPSDTY
jgi:flagellar motor component MotA